MCTTGRTAHMETHAQSENLINLSARRCLVLIIARRLAISMLLVQKVLIIHVLACRRVEGAGIKIVEAN